MARRIEAVLTPRQELILCKVVEDYLQSGQPVASKTIAADPSLDCGPSTVRNELALLEEHDLLAHPHTSAGRVPTDAGHRYVVDLLLHTGRSLVPVRPLALSLTRREVEDAMARGGLDREACARGVGAGLAEGGEPETRHIGEVGNG